MADMKEEVPTGAWEMTDGDLARFADWAERMEIASANPDWRKAYGAIRQGSDWLLRRRARSREEEVARTERMVASAERKQ